MAFLRRLSEVFSISAIVFVAVSCGESKKATLPTVTKDSGYTYDGGDANRRSSENSYNECTGSTDESCPRVTIRLADANALGGPVDRTMAKNIIVNPPAGRRAKLAIIDPIQDAQLTEEDEGQRINLLWNPTQVGTGTFKIRIRDLTRCQAVVRTACDKMELANDRVDTVVEIPFEVVSSMEEFDPINSNFFKQFKCDSLGYTAEQERAIAGGAEILVDEVADDDRTTVSNRAGKIAGMYDVLFNGEPEPSAAECLQRNQSRRR